MIRLKFTLNLMYNLIRENVGKTILLIVMIASFHYAGSFERYPEKTKIDKTIQIDSGYLYLYKEVISNEIHYKGFFYTEPQILDKQSNITIIKYNGFNILFWLIFIISVIAFVVSHFTDEGWDYNDVYFDTFASMAECEIENGKFVYSIMGKLVGISDRQLSRRSICLDFEVYNFSDLRTRPKFKTKSQHRNSLLNDLGI